MDRNYYFKIKHQYLIFKTFLILLRAIGITLLVFFISLVVAYSVLNKPTQEFLNFYFQTTSIFKVLLPIVIAIWILFKIINIIYVKKLSKLKRKINIIDEI